MAPLVSVMMPCYNSAHTLPMALASLLAQEHEDWECVLVDDGSTDNVGEVVERANDGRLRLIRLAENRGRGAARQTALENSRGEYICMLDADDWMYPWRISAQVDIMQHEPRLALVSSGMAVVDDRNDIVGVRCVGDHAHAPIVRAPLRRPLPPPVAHASSMLRAVALRPLQYDASFPLVEEISVLLQVLMNHAYCVMPRVTYVYTERTSVGPGKILLGHVYLRRVFSKYRRSSPFYARWQIGKSYIKSLMYMTCFALGLGKRIVAARCRKPMAHEREEFYRAREVVCRAAARFSSSEGRPGQISPDGK